VRCTGPAAATIKVTATPPGVSNQVTVDQKCKLEVAITSPSDGAEFSASDEFAVTATVKNNTAAVCESANVRLTISDPTLAELKGGSLFYDVGPIVPGQTQLVNWTVHCKAPGAVDLTVNATGCGQTDCAACDAKITIQQLNACGLLLTISSPPAGKICVDGSFAVSGTVKNTGNTAVTNVYARLTATTHASSVSILPSGWYNFAAGPVNPGDSVAVSWTVTCEGRELQGANQECLDELVDFLAEAKGTCGGNPVSATPVTLNDYANQKFVIVDLLPPTETCHNFCINDEWAVDADVHNCLDQQATGSISIAVSGNAMLVTVPGLPGAAQDMTLPPGATVRISAEGGPLPWHVKCLTPGDVTITVTYLGTASLLTLCDSDTAVVHQKTSALLAVDLTATPCVAVCQNFEVTAVVNNPGGANAATATNITVVMQTPTGNVSPVTTPDLTPFDLAAGKSKTLTWIYHCDDCANAGFHVDVTGTNPCGAPLAADDSASTTQVDLGVQITSPAPCAEFDLSQTFCVTARITNNDCDNIIHVSTATLSLIGNAELVQGETIDKPVNAVGENIAIGAYKDVSWTVHCKGPGDVDILVTANVTSPCALSFWDAISVHQKAPPVTVEILSPAYGTAFVATSQDFAVTAKVCNTGDTIAYNIPVTVDPGEKAAVSGEATKTIPRLDPKECTTLTWTLHCVEQGVDWVTVTAVGAEEVSDEVPILQYPAAHLEVQTLNVNPSGPFPVSTDFDVTATITNSGEADATEVNATLSVTPEGSVAVAAGGGGFTQYVGTIPRHGETDVLTWTLHCNEPSLSTITVTATGSDEYGWHQKQECQSTGNFVMPPAGEGSGVWKSAWCNPLTGYEDGAFTFDGKASGLTGPFNLEGEVSYNWGDDICCSGRISLMGYIDPALGIMEGNYLIKDAKPCTYPVEPPPAIPCVGWGEISVYDGLFNVVNGMWDGYFNGMYLGSPIKVAITNGTYCSTMASTPGLAIDTRFIEPASITVKQVAETDLGVTKVANDSEFYVGEQAIFTITVRNNGPAPATGVRVTDLLPAGLDYASSTVSPPGWYDPTSGIWHVGDLAKDASATLTITATVNTVGDISNIATITACDQSDPTTSNNSDMEMITGLEPAAVTEKDIELDEGWNLTSLPLYIPPEDRAPEDLLAGIIGNLDIVWAYNACEPDPDLRWSSFIPGGPPDLTEMRDGRGYWIDMDDGDTLTVEGTMLPEPPEVPPTYQVCEGWNLIGFKSTVPRTPSDYLAAIAVKYTIIYGFADGRYFIAGAPGHAYLEPGLGYWIAVISPGTIYP
jgi:uncharacterized repeat protein (TIGR01451 family)